MLNERCLICDSRKTKFWFQKKSHDDQKLYDIRRCFVCNSAYVEPPPTEEYLHDFYNLEKNSLCGAISQDNTHEYLATIQQQERDYPNSTIDAHRIALFSRKFANGKKFLDVGAGYGFFTKAACDAGFVCTAIEVGKNNCQVFKLLTGLIPINHPFDDEFANTHEQSFDVVLLSQVLEHMPNPKVVVDRIFKVLKDEGLCVIAVPHFGSFISKLQGQRDMFMVPPGHINFFSSKGLKNLFENKGFSTIKLHTLSRFDPQKLEKRIKPKVVSVATTNILNTILKISDLLNRGMFINAYFRKSGS